MKNGKKPSYQQRKFIQQNGLDSFEWLVVKDTAKEMLLVHRHSDKTIRTIYKEEEW